MILSQNTVPPQIQHFLDGLHGHEVFFCIQLLTAAVSLGYMVQRYIVGIVNQPKLNKQDIVYQEHFASGNSHRNILTRLGGASRCLRLVVTKELLWVTSWFPFSLFAAMYDLEHVIPLQRIVSIESKQSVAGQSLLLTFKDNQGKNRLLQLRPKNTELFVEALQLQANSSRSSSVKWQVGTIEPTLNLRQSLRRYWYHLIGVAVFPSVITLGGRWFHLPIWIIAPLFFGVSIYAMWPKITKQATYTFWIVACGIWMGGGVFSGILASIVVHLARR